MKVDKADLFVLGGKLARPLIWSTGQCQERQICLIRLCSEDGVTGWGELPIPANNLWLQHILTKFLLHRDISLKMVDDLSKIEDPNPVRRVIGNEIKSGLQIALLDIIAQLEGRSIAQLFGPTKRSRTAIYVSGLYYGRDNLEDMQELERCAEQCQKLGAKRLKVKLGARPLFADLQRIERAKKSLSDTEAIIYADANGAYDVQRAAEIGKHLRDHNIAWFEEPVSINDFHKHQRLVSNEVPPIALGENWTGLNHASACIHSKIAGYVQPNLARCGGPTPFLAILLQARNANLRLAPHGWGGPVFRNSVLQLLSLFPEEQYQSSAPDTLFEWDITPNPANDYFDHLLPNISNGFAEVALDQRYSIGLGETIKDMKLAPIQTFN